MFAVQLLGSLQGFEDFHVVWGCLIIMKNKLSKQDLIEVFGLLPLDSCIMLTGCLSFGRKGDARCSKVTTIQDLKRKTVHELCSPQRAPSTLQGLFWSTGQVEVIHCGATCMESNGWWFPAKGHPFPKCWGASYMGLYDFFYRRVVTAGE